MRTSLTTVCFPLSLSVLFSPSSSLSVCLSLFVCLPANEFSQRRLASLCRMQRVFVSSCHDTVENFDTCSTHTHTHTTHTHTHAGKSVIFVAALMSSTLAALPPLPSPFPAFSSCLIFFLIFLGQLFKCSWRCYCCFSNCCCCCCCSLVVVIVICFRTQQQQQQQ